VRGADALAELIVDETPAGTEPVQPRLQVHLVWNLSTGNITGLDGGPSDTDNLQLLCHACHGHAHRGSRGDPKQH
jgi:hypothetical protein